MCRQPFCATAFLRTGRCMHSRLTKVVFAVFVTLMIIGRISSKKQHFFVFVVFDVIAVGIISPTKVTVITTTSKALFVVFVTLPDVVVSTTIFLREVVLFVFDVIVVGIIRDCNNQHLQGRLHCPRHSPRRSQDHHRSNTGHHLQGLLRCPLYCSLHN